MVLKVKFSLRQQFEMTWTGFFILSCFITENVIPNIEVRIILIKLIKHCEPKGDEMNIAIK